MSVFGTGTFGSAVFGSSVITITRVGNIIEMLSKEQDFVLAMDDESNRDLNSKQQDYPLSMDETVIK